MPAARYGPYPIFRPEDFHIDGRLVAACYDRKANPYLFRATNGVFTANIAHILANESARNDPLAADCSYFSDKMASLNHYQGPFRYNLLRAVRQTTNGEPPYELVTNFEIVAAGKAAKPVEESLIFGMNWENLGQQYVPEEKPFASECAGALFRFTAVQESAMGHALSEKKVVSRANFIRDIKFLISKSPFESFAIRKSFLLMFLVPFFSRCKLQSVPFRRAQSLPRTFQHYDRGRAHRIDTIVCG